MRLGQKLVYGAGLLAVASLIYGVRPLSKKVDSVADSFGDVRNTIVQVKNEITDAGVTALRDAAADSPVAQTASEITARALVHYCPNGSLCDYLPTKVIIH